MNISDVSMCLKLSLHSKRGLFRIFALAGFVMTVLAGCATVPDTITHKKPEKLTIAPVPAPSNGSIFQTASYRPMFEDRRARLVGDTLTIVINEKTSAAKAGAGSASHTGSAAYTAPTLLGLPATTTSKLGISTSTSNKFEDKGAASSSNNFTGTIGVEVIDVMPNGNLLVSGEKQIAMDRGAEFIRISGIIDPRNIAAGNIVSSSLIADARVEYRTNTRLDTSDVMSQFARFFLSMMPL